MASTINASKSPAAIVQTADGTANLSLQSNGTTIAALTSTGMAVTGTLSASGVTTFAAGTAALPAITTTGDTNTGIFFSAADTIDFTEGGAACGQFDSSANFKFNSGYGSVATAFGCRAWVNFNGTGTVAIRGSGNVSSITDNGTGDYTVNFTTSMPDVNYSVVGMCDRNSGTENGTMVNQNSVTAPTTSAVRFCTFRVSVGIVDSSQMLFSVFR